MTAVPASAGGTKRRNAKRAQNGVAPRMNGSRRPSRERVRSLQ
jgi:hypothetical protein